MRLHLLLKAQEQKREREEELQLQQQEEQEEQEEQELLHPPLPPCRAPCALASAAFDARHCSTTLVCSCCSGEAPRVNSREQNTQRRLFWVRLVLQ